MAQKKVRVRGMWRGWRGDTLVELSDGSTWVQMGREREIALALSPDAVLETRFMDEGWLIVDGSRYKMPVKKVQR